MNQKTGQSPDRLHLTLRHLEVFLATAHDGSTRAAAERIARSQSAASSALVELESLLGAALFDRVGRRLVLNENGRAFLPRAASLVEAAGELEHLFQGQHAAPPAGGRQHDHRRTHPSCPAGPLEDVASPERGAVADREHHGRAGRRGGFRRRHRFHRGAADACRPGGARVDDRRDGDRGGTGPSPSRKSRRPPGPPCAPPAGPCASAAPARARPPTAELLAQLGQVRIDFELGTPEAVKALVAAGDALALLPRHSVDSALARGDLVELPTTLPRATRTLAVVTHRERTLGAGARRFAVLLRRRRLEKR